MNLSARVFSLCIISWIAILTAPASAQTSTDGNAGISGVLLDFGDMSNGWYLNARCKALTRAERREFEWGYLRIQSLINEELSKDAVTKINQTAVAFADTDHHKDCGPATKKLISQSLVTSRHINKALMDTVYDPKKSYNDHLSAQFLTIETGLRVDAECRHIPPSLISTIGRAHDAMIGYTIKVVGGNAINKLLSDAETASKQAKYEECGPATQQAVHLASKELRQLIEFIEHDAVLTD